MKPISMLFCTVVFTTTACALFSACDEQKQPHGPNMQGEEVPFTEFSFEKGIPGEEISARWVNLNHVDNEPEILIINSNDELRKHVEGDYPPIDFSKKTMLVAYGPTPRDFYSAKVNSIFRMSDGNYQLAVTALLYDTTIADRWLIAFLTGKIGPDSKFDINVKFPATWPE